ncbi:MAG: TolC family protein [Planctomycetaceae bacterium]
MTFRFHAAAAGARVAVRWSRFARAVLAGSILVSGCAHRNDPLHYPHDEPVQHYRNYAETISYPDVCQNTPEEVSFSEEPHTVLSQERSEVWDMPLAEAVAIALQNNRIIRSAGQFLSPGNVLLTAGERNPSVLDPAIQESGVLFGTRGVEAALAAFDANFATSLVWGRREQVQNNAFFGGGLNPGGTLTAETAESQTVLSKDFAYGGQLQVGHDVSYLWSNAPGQLFPSVYTGNVNARYRHPLLAGAGTEFTRIAGPITQSFGGITGVTQGVVIARINNDITIADFEAAVRNLIKDVEDTYWDLYLAYRNFDTAVTARNSALATWRFAKIRVELGANIDVADESQARDQYWAAEALVKNSRSNIFTAETTLRRLLGLPINEGKIIRPSDEPITVQYLPDWEISLAEALTHRVELRKQKWNIKSLELQLKAARSLTRPRLDFVGGYQVNGFGDELLAYNDADSAGTAQGLNSFYETLTQGSQTGWGLGFELTMPLGFRQAHAQVRNIELRLAKAREVLYVQEQEIGHELAVAFQELTRAYAAAEANYSRRDAAIDNVETIQLQESGEIKTVDEVLRAQERRAQAEVAFFTSVVQYNKSLTNLHFRKGTLLEDANIRLLEGGWDAGAYVDAYRRAQCRTGAVETPFKHTEPAAFVWPTPPGGVAFAHPVTVEESPSTEAPLNTAPIQPNVAPGAPDGSADPSSPEPYAPGRAVDPPVESAPEPLAAGGPPRQSRLVRLSNNSAPRVSPSVSGAINRSAINERGTSPALTQEVTPLPAVRRSPVAPAPASGPSAQPSSFDDYFGSFGDSDGY